jgi:hypothetical protein
MKPTVKLLKTPENSCFAQKRIPGVSFYLIISNPVNGSGYVLT